MYNRIEVTYKDEIFDSLGKGVKKDIEEDLQIKKVSNVRTIDVYKIDSDLTSEEAETLGKELFCDPIIQKFSVNRSLAVDFSWIVEVSFKPGVTDNVASTTKEGIADIIGRKFKGTVSTAKQYVFKGNISKEEIELISTRLLANLVIETYEIFNKRKLEQTIPRKKKIKTIPIVEEIDLYVSNEELMRISDYRLLSLNLDEMKKIKKYYKDNELDRKKYGLGIKPTDVELEMIAQTWSEHCKHKIFNAIIEYYEGKGKIKINSLFDTYIKKATEVISHNKDWLVSIFKDNAGIVSFDDNYNIAFKVETHNHPSAIEPYGGAVTGIVGVNRDIMGAGIGANIIFNTDIFCFAPPDIDYKDVPEKILHPKRIFKGVRRGVEHGGNKIGIPTVNGTIVFHKGYIGNPLVFCGTGGIMPKKIGKTDTSKKEIKPGDLIVMVGGRIGKDGIHGATFSSRKLDESTPVQAVQIGAPIVQKKMMDILLEARDKGYYRAITDNGAGGLSSSVGEMSVLSGGCLVQLEKAPVKYPGLVPWELWVSEAQERMTVAVKPECIDDFLKLCKSRDVEATVLGKFTDSGKIHVKYKNKTVLYLDLEFTHKGLPKMALKANWKSPELEEPRFSEPKDLNKELLKILSSYNICSKEWVIRQYDHEVKGTTVLKPLVGVNNDGPNDAGVIRPTPSSKKGIAVSNGINPKFGLIDPYWMSASCIDEAVRNIVSVGGNFEKISLLDNFCWGNPILSDNNSDGDVKLAQLVRAAKGCYDIAVKYGTPYISGKDSFHNEYEIEGKTVSIPPTLLISAMGIVDSIENIVSMDAKKSGDLVYIIGFTKNELGGSEYYHLKGFLGKNVPNVDPVSAKKTYKALNRITERKLVASIHDCSDGGLGVALAETAFSGGLGMDISLKYVPNDIKRNDFILFSESNSRFIVTIHPENKNRFENMLKRCVFSHIGYVTEKKDFIIRGINNKIIISKPIEILKESWQKSLKW
jgi:phosphoribosylformylglycinamidine synthase